MAFPPQDYSKATWRLVPEAEPALMQRYAVGGERVLHWSHKIGHGQDAMLLHLDVVCAEAVAAPYLLRAARQAWMALRFSSPIIAASTATTSDRDSMITYRVAASPVEAKDWASRTVQLVEPSVLEDDHALFERWRVWEDGADQAILVITPQSTVAYCMSFLFSHAWTDGVGVKALVSHFLATLSRYLCDKTLANREHAEMQWGREFVNLPPAYPEIVAEGESLGGPDHDATLGQIMQDLASTFPHALPYRSHATSGVEGRGSRLEHVFTEEQTRRIIRHSKEKGLTVNQLINAATYLTVLHDNPSAATDEMLLVGRGTINTRDRLRDPYNKRHGYTGFCINATALPVRVADIRNVDEDARLYVIAGILKHEYARQKAYPALLGVAMGQASMIIAAEKAQPSPPWAGPWFIGDGIERDLDPDYVDDKGAPVLSINDFYLHIRMTLPCMLVRAHTWRGRLKINYDYNQRYKPRHAVEEVMRDMVNMLSFAGSDDD